MYKENKAAFEMVAFLLEKSMTALLKD